MATESKGSVTLGNISSVVRHNLETKGVIGDLKAKIRAEVYHALEDKTTPCPPKPKGVFLASEIIRDYLHSFDLRNTVFVFNEEGGQPAEMRIDRHFLGEELGLNLVNIDSDVPLLVLLIEHLQQLKVYPPKGFGMSDSMEVDGSIRYENNEEVI